MYDRIEHQAHYSVPPARLWQALTDHREFGAWFGVDLEGPFAPGKLMRGRITAPGYEHLQLEAAVQVMQQEQRFAFTWHPHAVDPDADYSGETPTLVEFTLSPDEDGTLLRVTESGFDHLPAARREVACRMNNGGWAEAMDKIRRHLEGGASA
jgi:uncharacterized protein YndB with AHSA1/START domain